MDTCIVLLETLLKRMLNARCASIGSSLSFIFLDRLLCCQNLSHVLHMMHGTLKITAIYIYIYIYISVCIDKSLSDTVICVVLASHTCLIHTDIHVQCRSKQIRCSAKDILHALHTREHMYTYM
jgi:hypothetical protein